MNKNVIFITKDAMCVDYLPIYGNTYWKGKTPNIDELASKGTVFFRHYTAAPSTVMSNICMFTGRYAHETELSHYYYSHIHYQGKTLWTKAQDLGYKCHIIWDEAWTNVFKMKERYFCYGEETTFHEIKGFRQGVGAHYIHKDGLERNDKKSEIVFEKINSVLEDIFANKNEYGLFVWIHVPHVINGRTGYGTDIDLFDSIVGLCRQYFLDDCIYVSADHGNMNGHRGKIGYGHDVYEPAIRIPLITPLFNNNPLINDITSNVDISDIIFFNRYLHRDYIVSDSAFFAQPNRKIAFVSREYKYIYNKATKKEELYDLRTDPSECCNLINDNVFDNDRRVITPLKELYFYPFWSELPKTRLYFRNLLKDVWKKGKFREEFFPWFKYFVQTHGGNRVIKYLFKNKKKN